MEIIRKFRVSHALARLLHKFGSPVRITQGHFATGAGRESFAGLTGACKPNPVCIPKMR